MSKPSNKPQNISPDCWYYEGPKGIDVILYVTDSAGNRVCGSVLIPWGKLKASSVRCAGGLTHGRTKKAPTL